MVGGAGGAGYRRTPKSIGPVSVCAGAGAGEVQTFEASATVRSRAPSFACGGEFGGGDSDHEDEAVAQDDTRLPGSYGSSRAVATTLLRGYNKEDMRRAGSQIRCEFWLVVDKAADGVTAMGLSIVQGRAAGCCWLGWVT